MKNITNSRNKYSFWLMVNLLALMISHFANGQLLQSGYSILSCKPDASGVTLAVKDIRQLGTLWDTPANRGIEQTSSVTMPAIGPHNNGTWLTSDFGGLPVLSISIHSTTGDIYAGTTALYGDANDVIGANADSKIYKISGANGAVSLIATLNGQVGIGYVELDEVHNQVFAVGMDDGKIYRVKLSDNSVDSYDPFTADNGAAGIAPLGERLLGVTYNPTENRVYYSVWANDAINNATNNTIRSIGLNANGSFKTSSDDILAVTIPTIINNADQSVLSGGFLAYLQTQTFSCPVGDMEFNKAGNKLLIGELSFNSSTPVSAAHLSRILEYQKSGSTWSLAPAFVGNVHGKYDAGQGRTKGNSRGGVAWAYHDINASTGATNGDENFIIGTVDQVITSPTIIWGLQFNPSSGGSHANSIPIALSYNGDAAGAKSVYGDIDIYKLQATCTVPSSIQFTKTAPTCTGATANNNGKITLTAATGADKCGISTIGAATYNGPAYTTATAYTANKDVKTAIPNTGGSYILRLFNSANDCFKDTTITVVAVTCVAGCTTPTASTPVATQATCNVAGTAANNDAKIDITGIGNATVYAFTTDGSTPAFAGATAVVGTTVNLTALANPAVATTYKFRFFNGSATCFTDVMVVLNPKVCGVAPCGLPDCLGGSVKKN